MSVKVTTEVAEVEASKTPMDEQEQARRRYYLAVAAVDCLPAYSIRHRAMVCKPSVWLLCVFCCCRRHGIFVCMNVRSLPPP